MWDEHVPEPAFRADFLILSEALGRWRQRVADKKAGRKERAGEQVRGVCGGRGARVPM